MKLENKVKNFSANSDQIGKIIKDNNKVVDLTQQKYIVKQIDQTNGYYYASQISKNEKYLAYVGDDLKIYDIQLFKIIKEIKQDYPIMVCQFTCDSQQLFVGSYKSVYCYSVSKGFKLNHKLYIHQANVCNIITISNKFIITSSSDNRIIKTDTKQRKQLFKLSGHNNQINVLEYNDIDDIIVSCSEDKSIKLWSCKDKSIQINKVHKNGIMQIQLINNYKNLLSLDRIYQLHEWKIDLVNRHLIQLKQFNILNEIYSFYQVNLGQNLLLICNNQTKILNNQGQVINIVNHQTQYAQFCQQLDNANFILIQSLSNYQYNKKKSNQPSHRYEIIFFTSMKK